MLLVDGRGQPAGCAVIPHPYLLTPHTGRGATCPLADMTASMSSDTSLIHPLIQPEHLHKLCVGPKISGAAAGKRGRFMQSYGLQVAVDGIFNRN